MARIWRTALVTAVIAFLAGALGVYLGFVFFGEQGGARHGSLDDIVHREIDLSADQDRQIDEIEATYGDRRRSLETEMRAATREIAAAVAEDKSYTQRVRGAIDVFHNAMGELQHETILHVFEMRAVLAPDQQSRFDEIVRAELLRSSGDAEPN